MKYRLLSLVLALILAFPPVSAKAEEIGTGSAQVSENSMSVNDVIVADESIEIVEVNKETVCEIAEDVQRETSSSTYPSSYDPRETGMVSGVRRQVGGTCWIYAAVAAMESNLIKKGLADSSIDLSEAHIKYFTIRGFEDPRGYYTDDLTNVDTPFFDTMMQSGLEDRVYRFCAKWNGPVTEAEVTWPADTWLTEDKEKFNSFVLDPSLATKSYYHVIGYDTLATADETVENVKALITEYGAVSAGYYSAARNYYAEVKDSEASYCGTEDRTANHGIAIVGWDDNYSKYNFANTPSGNGAWLVKDSQGDGVYVYGPDGEMVRTNGYVWMSYYEPSLGDFAAVEMGGTGDYQNLYTHAGAELKQSSGYRHCWEDNNYFATIFTANAYDDENGREKICGIKGAVRGDYEIYVYLNPVVEDGVLSGTVQCDENGDPVPVATGRGSKDFDTIDFSDNAVTVDNGQKFAVVVKAAQVDSTDDTQQVGECYVGADLSHMNDTRQAVIDAGEEGNVANTPLIHVLTNPEDGVTIKTTSIRFKDSSIELTEGGSYKTTVIYEPNNATYQDCGYRSSDESVAKVNANGTITAVGYGTATITATSHDGSCEASCTVNVKCTGFSLSAENMSKGDTAQVAVTCKENFGGLTPEDFTWTSSNPSVVTVDEKGNLTAVGNGTATIIASLSKFTDKTITAGCAVTVTTKVTGVTLEKNEYTAYVGEKIQIGANVSPADATNKGLTYTTVDAFAYSSYFNVSSDGIVTVDFPEGAVTKSPYGRVRVASVEDPSIYQIVTINFKKSVEEMSSDSYNVWVEVGGSKEVTFTTDTVYDDRFVVTSTDESIAEATVKSYDDHCLVTITGKKIGAAVITVTANDGYKKSIDFPVSVVASGSLTEDDTAQTPVSPTTPTTPPATDDTEEETEETEEENDCFEILYKNVYYEYDGKDVIAWDAKNVKSITIPAYVPYNGKKYKVTKIQNDCFAGKDKMKKITIKANITSIGARAFEGCYRLKNIAIPASVKTIGVKAFEDCKKLKKITFKGTKLKKVGKEAFKGIHKNAVIKVPKKKLKAYTKLLKKKCPSNVKIKK